MSLWRCPNCSDVRVLERDDRHENMPACRRCRAMLHRVVPVVHPPTPVEVAAELRRLQAYGAERLAASGRTVEDIPAMVEEALTRAEAVAFRP